MYAYIYTYIWICIVCITPNSGCSKAGSIPFVGVHHIRSVLRMLRMVRLLRALVLCDTMGVEIRH